MEVATCTLRPDTRDEDLRYLTQAVAEGLRCVPSRTSYCVGAVVALPDGRSFTGYTHETSPTHHAEQEAIRKALDAGAELRGAAIYSSMEPCSQRKSEPESCTQLILRHGFARVVFALYEPDRFVCCRGRRRCAKRVSTCGFIPNWPKACAGPTPTSGGETGVICVHKGLKMS